MNPAQVLRQADILKSSLPEQDCRDTPEDYATRGQLQKLYTKALLTDLEYSLDKKIEQELWNHAFKTQITVLQKKCKDRTQNARETASAQAALSQLLDTASGFYLNLIQEAGEVFHLELPLFRRSQNYGSLEPCTKSKDMGSHFKKPLRSSVLYLIQVCLVHLGDLARYRQQTSQAQNLYWHAASCVPASGHPFNQLSILEAAVGQKLPTAYYNVRSLAVRKPFPPAYANLEKFYARMAMKVKVGDPQSTLAAGEMVSAFLSVHALLHLGKDLNKAQVLVKKLSRNTHVMSASSTQLIQMLAINLFALDYARGRLTQPAAGPSKLSTKRVDPAEQDSDDSFEDLDLEGENERRSKTPTMNGSVELGAGDELSKEEKQSLHMLLQLTFSLLESLVGSTPKQEQKARECHTLPVIKLILDWLYSNQDILQHPTIAEFSGIWQSLAKLLNCLQLATLAKDGTTSDSCIPLPEDWELQCFLPLAGSQKDLDFQESYQLFMLDKSDKSVSLRRCRRLIERGEWIAELPDCTFLVTEKKESGKIEFSTSIVPEEKPASPVESSPMSCAILSERKARHQSSRTNVAIQAIMRKNMAGEENMAKTNKKVTVIEPEKDKEKENMPCENIRPLMQPFNPTMFDRQFAPEVAAVLRNVPPPRPAPGTRTLWEPKSTSSKNKEPTNQAEAVQSWAGDSKSSSFFLAQPLTDQEAAELNKQARGVPYDITMNGGEGITRKEVVFPGERDGIRQEPGDGQNVKVEEPLQYPQQTNYDAREQLPWQQQHGNQERLPWPQVNTQKPQPMLNNPAPQLGGASAWGNFPPQQFPCSADFDSAPGGQHFNRNPSMSQPSQQGLYPTCMAPASIWAPQRPPPQQLPPPPAAQWPSLNQPPPPFFNAPLSYPFPSITNPPLTSTGMPGRTAPPRVPTAPSTQQDDLMQVNSNSCPPRAAVGQERQRNHSTESLGAVSIEVESLMLPEGGKPANRPQQQRQLAEGFNPASQVVGSPSLGLDREMARITEERRRNSGQADDWNPLNQSYPGTSTTNALFKSMFGGKTEAVTNTTQQQTPVSSTYSLFNGQTFWQISSEKRDLPNQTKPNVPMTSNSRAAEVRMGVPNLPKAQWNKPTVPPGVGLMNPQLAGSVTMPMQGLWSTGLSPLQQLIQQQRQKKNDPN